MRVSAESYAANPFCKHCLKERLEKAAAERGPGRMELQGNMFVWVPDGEAGAKPEPFTDVSFLREYPGARVADHEVFMSFNGDDQAIAFVEWWHQEGAAAFAAHLQQESQ